MQYNRGGQGETQQPLPQAVKMFVKEEAVLFADDYVTARKQNVIKRDATNAKRHVKAEEKDPILKNDTKLKL